MTGRNDDLEEVRGLLSGAGRRFGSARDGRAQGLRGRRGRGQPALCGLEVRERGRLLNGARERGAWWRRPREDFYRAYEDTERKVHLWHERQDRWREEWLAPGGSLLRCVVFGGAGGPRWVYEPPHTAIHDASSSEPWPREDPYTGLSFMLDPSEDLFSYALLDDATVHRTGRTARVVGREAVEVLVATISWGYPPAIFHGCDASMEGATDHLLLVDGETGTLMRVAARLEGREFRVAEATEVAYGERFPEGTFRLEVPGVEFR